MKVKSNQKIRHVGFKELKTETAEIFRLFSCGGVVTVSFARTLGKRNSVLHFSGELICLQRGSMPRPGTAH